MNEGYSDLLLVGVVALLLGIGLGLIISRVFNKGATHSRRVSQKMDELQNEHTRYQAQVNEHFMETAHRMRRLNDSYRDMYQHLAQGAVRLSNDEELREMLDPQDLKLGYNRNAPESGFEPPLDYAPKSGPREKGTLAEDFGFERGPRPDQDDSPDRPV